MPCSPQPGAVKLQSVLVQAPLVQLHWEQLSCEVVVGHRKQRRTLQILRDVYGSATSGTLLGIMGPTGMSGSRLRVSDLPHRIPRACSCHWSLSCQRACCRQHWAEAWIPQA